MGRIRDVGLRFAAALTCSLLSASLLTSCTKGTKNAAGVRASATNWKATPGELKNQYPPNKTILDPIKFVVTTKEGSPVPNINVEFKAFDVTPAYNGGVSTEAMKAEILNKWSDGNYVMNSSGSIAGNTCDAGFTRDICVGMLSGPSKVTNQNGEATVGLTTPNAPGGVIAVALRVPEDSTASELIEIVLVKITSNDDFANSGIEPLQSAFIVIPLLFDDAGRQVIQAGVPFNLAIYAPGIPNTAPGKGFMFDFVTEGLQEAADGSSVIVPTGSKRCEFRNSQCIVPGGPFRVLKPTTLSFSARPSDPKFPVKPASFSIPVISGKASQLIVALSPDTKNIQNACVDGLSLNKPCLVMSADTDKKELYPMLLDAGGNWVESPDTVWDVEGPLNEPNSFTTEVMNGKQELRPRRATPAGTVYDTIRVTVKGKSTYTIIKYVVTPGTPRKVKFTNTKQRATVPFPALMELRDQYENFCYNFTDTVGMQLDLTPLSDATPQNGLDHASVTKIGVLNRMTNKVKFTAGMGSTAPETSSGQVTATDAYFVVTKRPPINDTAQWPRISVANSTLNLSSGSVTVTVDANPLQIDAGPVTQTLWRDASGGGGANWSEKTEIDPVTGVALASDQQYNFYLAGYDAAANYSEDLSDVKYWGVKYTLDDKEPNLAAAFKSTIDQLFTKNPSAYSAIEACPKMAKTPSAGRPRTGLPNDEQLVENDSYINPDDQAVGDQPEGNAVFCGIHLGLSNKGGMSSLFFNSKGIPGTGRILAIPNGMYDVVDGQPDFSNIKIKPALSPKLSLVAGAATKFAFEMVSAEPATLGQVLVRKNMDDPMPTGHRFKLRIYAQDSGSTDASTYKGIKLMQVLFIGEKSWAGLSPTLPNANFSCNFGETISAACEIPDSYMLTDSRSSATLAVKQLTEGGVQGTFAKIMTTTPGQPARLIFASKKGGPTSGALVENSFERPLGRQIGADSELPLAVAVLDAGGSYVRDALSSDSIVFDGFRSEDGSYRSSSQSPGDSNIFNPATGQWKNGNGADWSTSYELSDVFVENSLGDDTTPPKFYSPDDATTPPKISLEESKNTSLYSTVFVPQNRFGSGFAVPRSSSNPNLIGWPSSWWTIKPGDPDHIETRLVRGSSVPGSWTKPGAPTNVDKTNWVGTSDRCYDVIISIHDKKHNLLYNYTGVVENAALKLININTNLKSANQIVAGRHYRIESLGTTDFTLLGAESNVVGTAFIATGSGIGTGKAYESQPDLKAGLFASEIAAEPELRNYYAQHNANLMQGPFRDGFFIPGATAANSGENNFSPSGIFADTADPSRNDWWTGKLSVNAGVIASGVKVCVYNGQTPENYTSDVPFAEKYIQLDMPVFQVNTAQTTFNFPAFQSRGAGVRFVGPDNTIVGSRALTSHTHEDVITVFRSGVDHLHPTFTDTVAGLVNGGKDATFRQINGDGGQGQVGEVPNVGITEKCPAPKCAGTKVYWHEHDVTHNHIRPAVSSGFAVNSTLSGAVAPGPADGQLGSPSTIIFGPGSTRFLDSTKTYNNFKLFAVNSSVTWFGSDNNNPRYRHGARVKFVPGPPKTMTVARTGASTVAVGDAFGVQVDLFDAHQNPAGGFIYGESSSDMYANFNIPRTLSLWFDKQPSNGPTSGEPRILDRVGANLANVNNPVTTVILPNPTQPGNPSFTYMMNLGAGQPGIRLVKAGQQLKLNVKLKDNVAVPWCAADLANCDGLAEKEFVGVIQPVTAVPGPTASIALTAGVGPDAVLYPDESNADADAAYAPIFNTNPSVGDTYPLGVSLAKTFRTYACGRDQFGNISDCDSLHNFEFVNTTNPNPAEDLTAMLNAKFFNWRATKPGSFAIKATKDEFTVTSAPIKVASKPLHSFGFENISTGQNIPAGDQFKFKVCMLDEAKNVITDNVSENGQVVTDPNGELTVSFTLFGMQPNPEGRSIELSKSEGSNFDTDKVELINTPVKFTNGCSDLVAKLYSASPDYSGRPLVSMSYIDTKQQSKTISGSGLTVNSVVPLGFHHFATKITKTPVVGGNAVVPAYSSHDAPGTNVYADVPEAGSTPQGNRFDLTVLPRDVHGNEITFNGSYVVKLQNQGSQSPSSLQLICSAPGNDSDCMNQAMNGKLSTIAHLAIDVPGSYFIYAETPEGVGKSIPTSAGLLATASLRTIKHFVVTAPSDYDWQGASIKLSVKAVDNRGNSVIGISDELNNSSKVDFTWVDDLGVNLSSRVPPFGEIGHKWYESSCRPTLQRPVFDSLGEALMGYDLKPRILLTRTRAPNNDVFEKERVKINLRGVVTGIASPITSVNNVSTAIPPYALKYELTCTKVSGGDCTGSVSSPVLMDASPENQFNLTVQSFDNCGNRVPSYGGNHVVSLRGGIGAGYGPGTMPENLGVDEDIIGINTSDGLQLRMGGQEQRTFNKLFLRAVGDAAYYISDPSVKDGGTALNKIYHRYLPTIATVTNYRLKDFSSVAPRAGQLVTFKLEALDLAGQVITGIDPLLNQQSYTWVGGGNAPNGEGPVYPTGQNPSTLSFTNGVTGNLSVTFKKAENIPDFYVKDDFQPGPSGVGGIGNFFVQADPEKKRRSLSHPFGTVGIIVGTGLPFRFALSTVPSTTVEAGSGFDVKVTVRDIFDNLVNNFGDETLTFSWLNASPSVSNPVTSEVEDPEVLPAGLRTFETGGASFTSTDAPFRLYRSNANAAGPLEKPTLKVVGSRSGATQTHTGQLLEATLDFTVQPANSIAYMKIADGATFSEATNFSGKAHSMSNDQTKLFHGHLFDIWGNYKGTSPLIRWSGSYVLQNKLAPDQGINTMLAPTLAGQGVVTASCTDVAAGCVSDSTGTITVNPSPLVSFDVKQISPPEGTIVAAGQQIDLKLCMLDKNQQVITQTVTVNGRDITIPNGPVSGISMSKTVHVDRTPEDYSIDISKSSGNDFDADVVPFALNTFTFVNGCVNLYAKVYKAGLAASYGMTKPLISFAYTDTEQNNLPVGGTGLRVGAVNTGEFHHYTTHVTDLSPTGTVPAWADPTSSNIFASVGGNRFSVSFGARDQYGNGVKVTKTVTLRLARVVDGVEEVLPAERLKCAAASPGNDQSCLTRDLSNIEGAWIANLAVDIPGDFFIHATDNVVTSLRARSSIFKAESSKKTVKSYALTVPATIIAGQQVVAKIEARDAADQVITGADGDLRSLRFDWLNGASDLISLTQVSPAPALANPFVPDEFSFNAGVANVPVTLVKATTGQQPLTINVRDRQIPTARSSNNIVTTAVSPGSQLRYAITCTNAGGDCSGTSAVSAASINASPTDAFNQVIA